MRVAIAFDALALDPDAPAEVAGVLPAVAAVAQALAALGHESAPLPVPDAPVDALAAAAGADLVFNLCESVAGDDAGELRWVAALELLGVTVTGAPAELIALARHKDRVAAILHAAGVATPESRTLPPGGELFEGIHFPAIVKPAAADGSAWITQRSVARDAAELRRAIAHTAAAPGGALVQPLLTGRELNVAFVGDTMLPISEIEYVDVPDGYWPIVDYAAKWQAGSVEDRMTVPRCPADIPDAIAREAAATARAAWRALRGSGCGRVDMRADAQGRLHVLEVNPNPDLAPDAGMARMAAAAGWSYPGLVQRLVEEALQRAPAAGAAARPSPPAASAIAVSGRFPDAAATGAAPARAARAARTHVRVAPLRADHRNAVERILAGTEMFRTDEIVIALEVIDAYLADPDRDYTALGAFTQDGELVGYTCHGPTPCTLGTFDLYWIAVDPAAQGSGVGSALLQEVERRLAMVDARLLLIETSSQPRYEPTRGFYERHGYREVARVPDFYALGDDRVIFAKRIHLCTTG